MLRDNPCSQRSENSAVNPVCFPRARPVSMSRTIRLKTDALMGDSVPRRASVVMGAGVWVSLLSSSVDFLTEIG
jgi:hypothetical protein